MSDELDKLMDEYGDELTRLRNARDILDAARSVSVASNDDVEACEREVNTIKERVLDIEEKIARLQT